MVAAVAAAAAALALYTRTLAPGLIGIIDTPVFQFVGRVLGVPHNPGYPAYVLVTHAWSYVPIGSLAYRMNLFSAVMGAAAAAALFAVARLAGASRAAALATALACACGRVFWSQAVIAEVYTLNAALLLALTAALLQWERSRRARWYWLAIVLLGVALGNHTTVVLFVPGMVAFALLVDARFALRPRNVAVLVLIAAATLAQYWFIVVRTRTPGAYVESPAHNAAELIDVIRGKQFASGLFAYPARQVVTERIPLLVRTIVLPELTWVGAVLAGIGIIWLARRRAAAAWLLGFGGVATLLFAADYDAVDIYVFLIPVFVVLWSAAAVGLTVLVRALPRRVALAAIPLAFVIPAVQALRNFEANDLSHQHRDEDYFRGLFAGLPDRTVFVREDFLVDRMVMYELLGEHAAGSRRIDREFPVPSRVAARLAAGDTVLAFPKSADKLRDDGLDVSYARRRVLGPPLEQYVKRLPPGSRIEMDVHQPRASVSVSGRDIVSTTDGTAVVVWNRRGDITDAFVAQGQDGFRVPLSPAALVVYEVRPRGPGGAPDLSGLLRPVDAHSDRIVMSRDEQSLLARAGWGRVEADGTGPYRWLAADTAHLQLPLMRPPVTLRVTIRTTRSAAVSLQVGSSRLPAQPVGAGWNTCAWIVPPDAQRRGDVDLAIAVEGNGPPNTVAVGDVVVEYAR